MIKNPRILVARFEERDHVFEGVTRTAVTAFLSCGHSINLGISSCRPKRMACDECGNVRRTLKRRAS